MESRDTKGLRDYLRSAARRLVVLHAKPRALRLPLLHAAGGLRPGRTRRCRLPLRARHTWVVGQGQEDSGVASKRPATRTTDSLTTPSQPSFGADLAGLRPSRRGFRRRPAEAVPGWGGSGRHTRAGTAALPHFLTKSV